jgi:UDP-N-acetylglucosamine 2-epimerase (non-hydrolysing)
MIDTLRHNLEQAVPHAETLRQHGAPEEWGQKGFAVLTLHRPSNVDDPSTLRAVLGAIRQVGERLPVAFAVHPRTRARIEQHGLGALLEPPLILRLPPIGYLEMLGLMRAARLVLTDSGGMQEETTALGVPCVTLRDTTERPITVEQGTNTIVGSSPARILAAEEILRNGGKRTDTRALGWLGVPAHQWLLARGLDRAVTTRRPDTGIRQHSRAET